MAEDASSPACCTIVAGPNGSGKSTIYPLLSPDGDFINADVVARHLNPTNPEGVSLAAGRLVLQAIDAALIDQRSFVYETTLSSRQSINVMERCKRAGYEVALVFVALDSAELNVLRVKERVSRGGHDIPTDVIRRRYETAFGQLPRALTLADSCLLFDNSGRSPQMLMALKHRQVVENNLDEAAALHVRLAEAVAEALQTEADVVFRALRHD